MIASLSLGNGLANCTIVLCPRVGRVQQVYEDESNANNKVVDSPVLGQQPECYDTIKAV